MLEQGPRYTRRGLRARRARVLVQRRTHQQARHQPADFPQDCTRGRKTVTDFPAAWYAPMVGGSSNALHGELLALPRSRLQRAQPDRRRSPGTTFADWPITYAELEPYYTKVEWEIGVSGLAGASPFDPPRSKPYPMPPLPVKSSGVLLERGARKLGLHPFPAPMAIASQPYRDRPACAHCGFCIGFGCEVRAKSSTLVHGDSRGRGDRTLRSAQRQLRRSHRDQRRGSRDGRDLLRHGQARALPASARRRRLRERRGDGAPAADVGQLKVSRRPRQFERPGRQEPDVQHVRAKCTRCSSTS